MMSEAATYAYRPYPQLRPSAHTVLGFAVSGVRATVDSLRRAGVSFERIPGLSHDLAGIFTAPDGAQVAWFRDPDGNLVSVVQYA